jgi:hypothetical protein
MGVCSLLMVPAILVSFTAAELLGSALQSSLGLNENESLTKAGALGVAAAVLLALVLVVPQGFGIVLGWKARRAGASRLGVAGLTLNLMLAAFMLLTAAANLVFM